MYDKLDCRVSLFLSQVTCSQNKPEVNLHLKSGEPPQVFGRPQFTDWFRSGRNWDLEGETHKSIWGDILEEAFWLSLCVCCVTWLDGLPYWGFYTG